MTKFRIVSRLIATTVLIATSLANLPTTASALGKGATTEVASRFLGSIATGSYSACALTKVGAVKCWGYDDKGQIGNGELESEPTFYSVPQQVSTLTSGVSSVHMFNDTACALKVDGTVWCWGDASRGTFGIEVADFPTHTPTCDFFDMGGSEPNKLWCHVPVKIEALTNVTSLSIGWGHSCAITNGTLKCWGSNGYGELGNGTPDDGTSIHATPAAVTVLGSSVAIEVAVGLDSTCILDDATNVKCWGSDIWGTLGTGSGRSDSPTPLLVKTGMAAISHPTGGSIYCAIESSDGELWCWGMNYAGSTGTNTDPNSSVYEAKTTGLLGVVAVHGGYAHTCAILDTGVAKCWGDNSYGQVGVGTWPNPSAANTPQSLSVIPNNPELLAITGGDFFTCAISIDRNIWCWGSGNFGELGVTPGSISGCNNSDGSFYCYGTALEIDEFHGLAGFAIQMPRGTGGGSVSWGAAPKNDTSGDVSITKQFPSYGFGTVPIGKELILVFAQDNEGRIRITPHMRMKKFVGQVTYSISISGDAYSCTNKKFGTKTKNNGTDWSTFSPGSTGLCGKISYLNANRVYTGQETITLTFAHARLSRSTGKVATPRTTTVTINAAAENAD